MKVTEMKEAEKIFVTNIDEIQTNQEEFLIEYMLPNSIEYMLPKSQKSLLSMNLISELDSLSCLAREMGIDDISGNSI